MSYISGVSRIAYSCHAIGVARVSALLPVLRERTSDMASGVARIPAHSVGSSRHSAIGMT